MTKEDIREEKIANAAKRVALCELPWLSATFLHGHTLPANYNPDLRFDLLKISITYSHNDFLKDWSDLSIWEAKNTIPEDLCELQSSTWWNIVCMFHTWDTTDIKHDRCETQARRSDPTCSQNSVNMLHQSSLISACHLRISSLQSSRMMRCAEVIWHSSVSWDTTWSWINMT